MLSLGRDAARSAAILDDLEFRHGIDVSTLDVAIEDGVLLARGLVSDADELESVRETLLDACVDDVLGFHVQVAPGRREEDRDQASLIQDCFDQDETLGCENIQVACYVEKVVLRGTVSSETAKVKAGILALRLGRAARLRNRLVVVP